MSGNLYVPFPQKSTRTFWKCAKAQATVIPSGAAGLIQLSANIPFRDLTLGLRWYRITKIRFSGNWEASDYSRIIADTSAETKTSTLGNLVDKYGKSVMDDQFDLTEYFELDFAQYWYNNAENNALFFQANLNLVTDLATISNYGDTFEARLFIQLQELNDDRWIDAITLGKV